MITEELKNFTNKVSGNITKITQEYDTAQENTGKLIENAISQALTKTQSTTTLSTSIDIRNFGTNYTNPPYETSWTSAWPTPNHNVSQQPKIDTHQIYRLFKDHIPTQTHIGQQHHNQTPFYFNQSVVKLFRCQIELIHSTQCLHHQTTDALNYITRSSSHQEKIYTSLMISPWSELLAHTLPLWHGTKLKKDYTTISVL